MSASFSIEASTGCYEVRIQSGALHEYLSEFPNGSIISDRFFEPVFAQLNRKATFVEATEENKSLDRSPALIEQLRKAGANRQTELVSVGGGIVQDISAFIASVYMRGLTWSYLPTTVLAMVDSCIGGKSSINVGPYKNLVGTFHPPRQVLVDPSLAETLPEEEVAGGLIEAAKICFCRGAESFDSYLSFRPSPALATKELEGVIVASLAAKKWFIEIDEFDKKERLLLNFGHTFGHAIEGATHFAISHGIAVGIGILCAIAYERARGTDYSGAPQVALLEEHLCGMVKAFPALGDHLRAMPMADVLERFASDKKHGPDTFTVIVISEKGEVVMSKASKTPEVLQSIRNAVESTVERFA